MAIFVWPAVLLFSAMELLASIHIRPELKTNYLEHPRLFVVPFAVAASLISIPFFLSRKRDTRAFYASAVFLAAILLGAAVALYPVVLPASGDRAFNLTIYQAASSPQSLRLALYWWLPGIAVAIAYFVFLYRMFRGKVTTASGYGH